MFTNLSPDHHTRIATDHLPAPAFARLLRVSKGMNTLLKPEFEKKVKAMLLATAHVPKALADALFALYKPRFVCKGVEDGEVTDETTGAVLSRDLFYDMPWVGGSYITHRVLSVETPLPQPMLKLMLNYTPKGSYHRMSVGRLNYTPVTVVFVMESENAGTYVRCNGETGEYADGILALLRGWGFLPE